MQARRWWQDGDRILEPVWPAQELLTMLSCDDLLQAPWLALCTTTCCKHSDKACRTNGHCLAQEQRSRIVYDTRSKHRPIHLPTCTSKSSCSNGGQAGGEAPGALAEARGVI